VGIFDFVKEAGAKVLGKDDQEKELIEKNKEMIFANKLKRHIMALGFEVENLKVEFDDGVATVRGMARTQGEREKIILALGNTEGVATVDDRMDVGAPEPEAQFYTVKKGDTLSKIAKECYGDPMKYPTIFEANKPMLEDPNLIYPGQVLRIPALQQ
jgi:nucleoid-associated protein YgaU